jgi:hypothetical protein
MSTQHVHHPKPALSAPRGDDHVEQPVLLVGVCAGHRCAALRRLHSVDPHPTDLMRSGADDDAADTRQASYSESEGLIRQAIRDRCDAVLVSLPCLGPCAQGSVAALGAGVAGRHAQTWL